MKLWNCGSFRIAVLVLVGTGLCAVVAPEGWLVVALLAVTGRVLLWRMVMASSGASSGEHTSGGESEELTESSFETEGATPHRFVADVLVGLLLLSAIAFAASIRIERIACEFSFVEERVATITGTLVSFPQPTKYGTNFIVRNTDVTPLRCPLPNGRKVFVKLRRELPPVSPGDTLTVTGVLRSPQGARNPGGFSEAAYLFQKGTSAVLTVPGFSRPVVRRVEPPRDFLAVHVAPARRWIDEAIRSHVPGEEKAFLLALVLGDRGELTHETKAAFRDSGIVHLLAVSGLHTALVGMIAFVFFRGVRLPLKASMVGSVAVVWFYCSLSGFHPSTLRASVMVSCFVASRLLGRSAGLVSPLCTSCVILLLANPRYIWDPGFQLSYAATFSILGAAPAREFLKSWLSLPERFWKYVVSPAVTTSVAQLGVLPVLAFHFGAVSAMAVPTNLVAIPLVSGALVSCFCSLALLAVVPPLASSPFVLSWLLLRLCTLLAHHASSVPGASFELLKPRGAEVVVFLICLFVLLRYGCVTRTTGDEARRSSGRWRRRARKFVVLAAGLCMVSLLAFLVGARPPRVRTGERCVRIDFLDVGQGDAAVIHLADGRLFLIDGGESQERWDCAERVLLPFLRNGRRRSFDTAVVTHFHSDHVGGILRLLEKGKVGEILISPADTTSSLSTLFRNLAEKKNVRPLTVSRPDTLLRENGLEMVVLHPSGAVSTDTSSASLNDSSVVTVLRNETVQFIFTGDVGALVMDRLTDVLEPRRISVLKGPHHGSRLSVSEHFAEEVRPQYVVFSAGRKNRFGHPAKEAVAAYEQRRGKVFRTDRDGCVSFSFSGDSLLVSTADPGKGHGLVQKARRWRQERRLRLLVFLLWAKGMVPREHDFQSHLSLPVQKRP